MIRETGTSDFTINHIQLVHTMIHNIFLALLWTLILCQGRFYKALDVNHKHDASKVLKLSMRHQIKSQLINKNHKSIKTYAKATRNQS